MVKQTIDNKEALKNIVDWHVEFCNRDIHEAREYIVWLLDKVLKEKFSK